MTEKLYYIDAYTSQFSATVLSCEPEKDGFAVTLDRTAFFPEEGGQYADTGYIENVRVLDAKERVYASAAKLYAPPLSKWRLLARYG